MMEADKWQVIKEITLEQAKKMKLVFVDRIGNTERYGNGTGNYWIVSNFTGVANNCFNLIRLTPHRLRKCSVDSLQRLS
jgi:hypothetical protein